MKSLQTRLKMGTVLLASFLVSVAAAQTAFPIQETFKTNSAATFTLGGSPNSAVLTSGNPDTAGNGWLRLTNNTGNQTGFAFYNNAFSSTLGVVVDFDFASWGSTSVASADGISFFLIDGATASPSIGAFGGSLGYAQKTKAQVPSLPADAPGVSNGVIGVGLDEYGNYATATEGRSGGTTFTADSVTLRGPGNGIIGYDWLTTATSAGDSIDIGRNATSRPDLSGADFRHARLVITPDKKVSVWVTYGANTTPKLLVNSFQFTGTVPSTLKLGFGASTGGYNDYHELRNLVITAPTDLSITKTDGVASVLQGGPVSYTIVVKNNGQSTVTGATMTDTVPASITGVTWTCAASAGSSCTDASGNTNAISAKSTLAAGGTATYTVTGTVSPTATGPIANTAKVDAPAANTDTNLNDNSATDSDTVTPVFSISGQVYEDYNYGGGAGRAYNATQGMSLRPSVRVELYSAANAYLAATLTDASGAYSFTGQLPGTYKVRVVNGFVTSSRGGGCAVAVNVTTPPASCTQLPVQTYINGASQVGGANPALTDPALSPTTLPPTAQSVASVAVSTANVVNVDFGFNFSTVVNVGNTGQGSLRQFITNANALANTTLAQSGNRGAAVTGANSALPAARDTSIFVIPSAALTSGVAVISPVTVLPAITRANISIDGTTQTLNIGNTNTGTLGTGGTVGYINTATLDTVQKPEVQLVGTSAQLLGLDISANGTQVRGLSIYGFGNGVNSDNNANIRIKAGFANTLIEANILGSPASSFNCGANTTVALSNADNIRSASAAGGTVQNNLIGCAAGKGFGVENNSVGWNILNNEIRGNAIGNPTLDGIDLENSGSKTHVVRGNLIAENGGVGVDGYQGGGNNLIERNTITGNGIGQGGAPGETAGVRVYSSNNTLKNNVISLNYGAGVMVIDVNSGNLISQNSIFDNGTVVSKNGTAASGQIGIDLLSAGQAVDKGVSPYVTKNDSTDADTGGNDLLNFPVFNTAQILGGNLQLTGFARPGSTIELFIAAADGSGFGEGKTYLTTLTESSAADTDTGTGTYAVTALGTDTTNRFAFSIPLPAGVAVGTSLTATATCSAATCPGTTVSTVSETSEFSYNILVTATPPVVTLLKLGRNVTKNTAFTDGTGSVNASPKDVIEYCLVYGNTGGAAPNFKLIDNVPAGLDALPDAYTSGKGIRSSGTVIAAGATATPTGTDLTNAADTDAGTLTFTGGTFSKGVMTLDLGAAGLAAGGKGTACFQARVP